MGQWEKGQTPEGAVPISEETAKEYQRRSAEKRKENNLMQKAVLKELAKSAGAGTDMTRLEYLVAKATSNHSKGKMTFKDLKDLKDLMGENVQQVQLGGDGFKVVINTPDDYAAVDALVNREQ